MGNKKMTNEKKIELLKTWQAVSKQYTDAITAYMDVTWCSGDAPHIRASDGALDEYTKLVSELTGIPFAELLCWTYDLQYGDVASYDVRVDGEWRSAKTIEELFELWYDLNEEVAENEF